MTIYLKQSTASQEVPFGYFVSSTDGNTEQTGLTIANTDIKIWKNGAITLANKNSGGATAISNGIYYAVLDATDTDTLGPMVIFIHVSSALPIRLECVVLAANIFDSLIGGGDLLDTSVVQWTGTNVATPDTAGYPKVTIKSGTGAGEVNLSSGNLAGSVASVAGAVASVTAAVTLSAKDSLAVRNGTAQAGAASTITLDAGSSAVDSTYVGLAVKIDSGTGAGQSRIITAYVGSTKVATVDRAWITQPTSSSVFTVYSEVAPKLNTSLEVTSASVTGNVGGSVASVASGGITAASFATDSITNTALAASAVNEIADQVWDEALSGHTTPGSTGAALASAGSAGDPWGTPLPGAYGVGSAGYIIGTNLDALVSSRLAPTTAGRTLDVTTGGEAGIDWANIGSPTTTVNLSGTSVKTATDVETDTQDIQSRLPAALVSGRMSSDAVAISGSTTAADNVEANIGNLDATVSSRLASVSYTTPPTVSAIADQVWDETLSGHLGVGSTGAALNAAGSSGDPWNTSLPGAYGAGTAGYIVGTNVDATVSSRLASGSYTAPDNATIGTINTKIGTPVGTVSSDIAAVQSDTDNIQTRLPSALVSGKMDASVGAYQSGQTPLQPTVAGRTLDVSAGGEAGLDWANIGSPTTAVNLSATNIDVDQVVASVSGNVSGSVASVVGNVGGSVASVTAPVTLSAKDSMAIRNGTAQAGGASTITLDAGASATDSIYVGEGIRIDSGTGAGQTRIITAYVGSTKVATVDRAWVTNPTSSSVFTIYADEGAKLNSSLEVTSASVSGAVASIGAGGITASSFATDAISSGSVSAGAVTKIQTGLATAAALATVQSDTDDIQTRLPAALVSGRMDSSVGAYQTGLAPLQPTVAGRSLDVTTGGEAGIDWANIGSPTTTVNLSGTTIKTATDIEADTQDIQSRLPAALVSGRMSSDAVAISGSTTAADNVEANIPNLDATVSSRLASVAYTTPPTAAANADAVWDETLSGHLGAGSTGAALNTASSAGDPWSTALPGAYTSGQAGYIVGHNVDAQVSTRLPTSSYTAPDNATIGTINTKIGTPSTTVSGDIAAVQSDTDNIQTRIPAALVSGRMDASVGAYQSGLVPLQPTVSGRTLDVSTGGEAGVDWANIGSPTTTVNLSGTSVKTATDVETDTQDIQSRLPAALVSGRMSSDAVAISGSTVAADAVETNIGNLDATVSSRLATSGYTVPPTAAANADAVWDETLAGHLGVGSTGAALNAAGSAGDPWVTTLPGAYGAGTAGYIIGNNLDDAVSSRLASASYTAPDNTTIGTINTKIGTPSVSVSADIAAVQSDTNDIQTRLPAALVSGRMDASVGTYQSGQTPLQPTTPGRTLDVTTTGEAGIDWANIGSPTTAVNLSGTSVKTATDVETDTQDIQSRLPAALVSGRMSSDAVAISGSTVAADAVETNISNLDATVSSRLATSGYTVPPTAAANADAVWDEALSGHTTPGSTGAALASAGSAGDPWGTPLPGAYGAGSAGYIIGTNLDALVSSRLAPTTAGRTLDVSTGGEAGLDWANVGSPTTTVNLSGTSVKTATDVETDTQDIQSRLPAALVGGLMASDSVAISGSTVAADAVETNIGNLNAQVSTRLPTSSYTAPDNATISTINTKIGTPSSTVSADIATRAPSATALSTAQWTNGRATNLDNLDATVSSRLATVAYTTPPTAAANADAVWDEPIAGHLSAGSTGAALNAAGASGDPWIAPLPGAYAPGQAGYIIGNNIDATIASRLPTASYVTPPTAAANADAVWDEPIAGHLASGSTGNKLNSAASAGDPWGTAVPGAYAPGEAGYVLGNLSSGGATPEQIWEYENRTLTMSNVSQETNVNGQSPTLLLATVASSFSATVSGIDTANIDKLWFTIKQNPDYSDQRSILQIENPGGLLYLNARPAAQPLDASLTVLGSTVTIDIDVAAMSELQTTVQAIWDIKKLDTFGIATVLVSGYIQIKPTVTLSY